MSDLAIFIFFAVGLLIFFYALLKITWSISGTGIDIMEFFGNAGRAGTSREQKMSDYKKKDLNQKWKDDGSKEI